MCTGLLHGRWDLRELVASVFSLICAKLVWYLNVTLVVVF